MKPIIPIFSGINVATFSFLIAEIDHEISHQQQKVQGISRHWNNQ